jgi:hypothetical protein
MAAIFGAEYVVFQFVIRKWTGVFENRVLKGIFWPKMDKVRGEWRKLDN